MSTDAVPLNYQTVRAMAEAICRADKGYGPGDGYDAQPSGDRARYDVLAEGALVHVAHQRGLPAIEPVPGAGWRRYDGAVVVAVGDPSGGEVGVPDGFDLLYRALADDELPGRPHPAPAPVVEHETTPRGFRTYRIPGGCHGQDVQVTESSIAFEGAHVRIYHGDDEHVQFHVDAAEKVAEALLDFVRAARAGELTEPAYREDGDHGHEPPAG